MGRSGAGPTLADSLDARRRRASDAHTGVWQKQQPRHAGSRLAQPSSHGPPLHRKRSRIGVGKCRDPPSGGGRVPHHQQARHSSWRPPTTARYPRRETGLAIQRVEHRLGVRHDRLDLHDQKRAGTSVACQHVHGSALTKDRERNLHGRLPSFVLEQPDDTLDQARVRLVHQPIETFASPSKPHLQVSLERRGQSSDLADSHGIDVPAFDQRHGRAGRRGTRGQIRLSPTMTHPKGAHLRSESYRIHASIVAAAPARAVILCR